MVFVCFLVDTQFHALTIRAESDLALAMQVCKGAIAAPNALILGCTVSAGRGWKHTALVNIQFPFALLVCHRLQTRCWNCYPREKWKCRFSTMQVASAVWRQTLRL